MAQSVLLPDGSSVTIRAGETPQSAYARAQQMYPEAFGVGTEPQEQPKSGFVPALKAGASSLAGSGAALAGRLGIMGLPEAEKYIAEQEAYQKKTFAPTTQGWTEAPLTKIAELAGGSIPYMAAPLVAGAAALPVTGALGTALGLGAAGLTSAGQFTGSNLSRQMGTGKQLGETDLGAAALAAIPQAALDTVSMRMIPGLGKMFERAGVNISAKAANDLAKEGIKKTAADYLLATGKTMGTEGLTEAGQQVFERMQAGLNLTDPAARAEYFDNFLGGAVLGGILAPAGRYVERGQEQGRFDQNQRDAQKQRSLEESQAKAEAAAKLEAERQTPEYALEKQQAYQAAKQRETELRAQLHKGSKKNKLTEEQKQENKETTRQLNEHAAVLSDANSEYRRVTQFLPTDVTPVVAETEATTPVVAEAEVTTPAVDPRQQVADINAQIEALQTQAQDATPEQLVALGTQHADLVSQLAPLQVAVAALPPAPPAPPTQAQITAQLKRTTTAMNKAKEQGDLTKAGKYAATLLELQKQLQAPETAVVATPEDTAATTEAEPSASQPAGPTPLAPYTGIAEQSLMFPETEQAESVLNVGQGKQPDKSRIELIAQFQAAKQVRDRLGMQNAIEKIRVLDERSKARSAEARGKGVPQGELSKTIPEMLGQKLTATGSQAPSRELVNAAKVKTTPVILRKQIANLPNRLSPESEQLVGRVLGSFDEFTADQDRMQLTAGWLNDLRTGVQTARQNDVLAEMNRLDAAKQPEQDNVFGEELPIPTEPSKLLSNPATDEKAGPPAPERKPAPVVTSTLTEREAADAAQRKAENERVERLAAVPGESVSFEAYRQAVATLAESTPRLEELSLKAADETLPKTTRDKANREIKKLSLARKFLESTGEGNGELRLQAEEEMAALKEKIEKQKQSVAEKPTASRKQELSKSKRRERELTALLKGFKARAQKTPIETTSDKAVAAKEARAEKYLKTQQELEAKGEVTPEMEALLEVINDPQASKFDKSEAQKQYSMLATQRLPARKIGPVVRKAQAAGNIRTGEGGEAGTEIRRVSPGTKPTQGGATKAPTPKRAVKEANKTAEEKIATNLPLTSADIKMVALQQHYSLFEAAQNMRRNIERVINELQEKMAYAAKAASPSEKNSLLRAERQDKLDGLKVLAAIAKNNEDKLAKAYTKKGPADVEEKPIARKSRTQRVIDETPTLYRTKTSEGAGMKEQEVARLADRITANWTTIPEIVVVATEKGLPLNIQEQAKRDNMTGKIPGLYDTETKKVYLVAENLHTGEDVALTVAHEIAGHFGLREMLGGEYTKEMNGIYNGNKSVRTAADAKMKANDQLSKETAVEEVLADIAETGPTAEQESVLRRIYNVFKRMLARVSRAKYVSDEEVRQVVANARHYVQTGEGGRGGEVAVEKAVFRAADYKSDDALSKAAQRVVAQPKTLLQKVRGNSNVMLEAQMEGADMRAGVITALNNAVEDPRTMGSTKLFRQAIFSITAADQHMPITQMAATMGPPKMFKDEKGYYEVRSSMENSAIDVFDSVQDIPDRYGNAEAKMGIASMYMIAQRAMNKGLAKLDTGAMGVTEQELQDVMRSVDADPELKAALEKTRKLYNAYNKGMIEWLSSPQVAAISRDDAKAFLKDEDYVPYYRVLPNGNAELVFGGEKTITIGDIKHQPYLAELKGGDAKIMPLNQSVMRNTMLLVTKGMTNMAQKNIAYAMQAAGEGQGQDKKNLMPVHKGQGVADPSIIRWTQEPDPSDPKDKGERWLRIQTNDTMFGGIPAELIIKSLEGAHLTLPAFLKLGGMAGDLLRSGVTRTPIYLARQLIRDPFAATATAGLDYGPLTAIFRANKEFLKMTRGQSETGAKLIEKGLVQSGIFDGSPADMEKMALQLAGGKSLSLLGKLFKGADSLAIKADAATRALIYDNAIKNGLSEAEASYAVRESMNFYKRGLSPTVQYASRMIPFFNAQIQGLSVLFKAARGNMPFDEQLKIRKKFINNAMMLTGFGIAYAMAMDDDEYYKNAKPRDRYSNFFIPLPGVDEPIKIPIPYEFGWFFSAGVAAADAIKGEVNTPQQLRALKDMFVGAIPGGSNLGMPQIIKPIAEVYANKSFFSGNPILSTRLEKLDSEAQYNANTTELAKWFGRMVPGLSPVQLEHIVSGYLGQIPLMVAASADSLFAKDSSIEEPTRKLSEMPLIGSSFQRKYGGEDADVVYKLADEALQAKRTFDNYRSTGKIKDAKEYLQDHRAEIRVAPMAMQYQKVMGQIRKQENIIRGSSLDGDAKAKRIEELNKQRQLQSERYMKAIQRAEAT